MVQSLLFVFGRFQRGMLILCGFAAFMLLGALLLMLPAAQTGNREIGFIDALFTSVSAVSVTGMSLINMKEDLTFRSDFDVVYDSGRRPGDYDDHGDYGDFSGAEDPAAGKASDP